MGIELIQVLNMARYFDDLTIRSRQKFLTCLNHELIMFLPYLFAGDDRRAMLLLREYGPVLNNMIMPILFIKIVKDLLSVIAYHLLISAYDDFSSRSSA